MKLNSSLLQASTIVDTTFLYIIPSILRHCEISSSAAMIITGGRSRFEANDSSAPDPHTRGVLRHSGHGSFVLLVLFPSLSYLSSGAFWRSTVCLLVSHTHDTMPTASTANPGMWMRTVHSPGNAISAHLSESGIVCHSLRIKLCRHWFCQGPLLFCYVS